MAYRGWSASFAFLAIMLAPAASISPLIHPDVVKGYNKSGEAVNQGDYQLAMALLEGAVYPNGVKVAVENDDAARGKVLAAAIAKWKDVLGGDSPIRQVSTSQKPDIVVKYVPRVPAQGNHTLGLIQLRKQYRWNRERREVNITGTIFVATQPDQGSLTQSEQIDVVMHELGHLLGLDDRSAPGTLMGPMRRGQPNGTPSNDEVKAVQDLRQVIRERMSTVALVLRPATTGASGGRHQLTKSSPNGNLASFTEHQQLCEHH